MAYINGAEILFSSKISMIEDSVCLPSIREALITKGGAFDESKRIEDVATAIYDLPVGDTSVVEVVDTDRVYEKTILSGAVEKAILNSISGASYASKNLYNPNGSQFAVNEDGSIHIVTEANMSGPTSVSLPSVTLNAGTYYLHWSSDLAVEGFSIDGSEGYHDYTASKPITITLDTTQELYIYIDMDGTSFWETGEAVGDIYMMISETADATFEPYFEGLRNTAVTEIRSYNANEKLIYWTVIPARVIQLADYGVEGNTVDFDRKKYFRNNTVKDGAVVALESPEIIDISGFLLHNGHKIIDIASGGRIDFVNEHKKEVPSTIRYIRRLS